MNWNILIPLYIGMVMVLQGGFNRKIALDIGIAQLTLLGSTITTLFCIAFYFWVKKDSALFPEDFHITTPFTTIKWWYVFPAFFGFCIVAGLPMAISRMGAVEVTVGLIAAQVITSALWDQFIEKISITPMKIIGVLLAVSSVMVILLSGKGANS